MPNPRYAEAEGALLGQFRRLHIDIYGNREFVEHPRNRGRFFDHEEKREMPERFVSQQLFTTTDAIGFSYGVTWNTVRRNIFSWKLLEPQISQAGADKNSERHPRGSSADKDSDVPGFNPSPAPSFAACRLPVPSTAGPSPAPRAFAAGPGARGGTTAETQAKLPPGAWRQ